MITRKKKCKQCSEEFTTSQVNAKFCSDQCRNKEKANKQREKRTKLSEKRIQRLSTSEEWLWISRECKRAGTVEILHSHTVESLEELFDLRNYRYKCYGRNPQTKVNRYHLCHIAPANGVEAIGLLHPLNLFVGASLQNQQHGTNHYVGTGLSIPRSSLKSKWLVDDSTSDKKVLNLVAKYLGDTLLDFAADNKVEKSKRLSLVEWIDKNDSENKYALSDLNKMDTYDLRKIKAEINGDGGGFQVDLVTRRSLLIYLDESARLSAALPDGSHKDNLAFMVDVLRVACAYMFSAGEQGFSSVVNLPPGVTYKPLKLQIGKDHSKFRDFIGFQAFEALQGAPIDRELIAGTLRSYLSVNDLKPDYSKANDQLLEHFRDDHAVFTAQLKEINVSLSKLNYLGVLPVRNPAPILFDERIIDLLAIPAPQAGLHSPAF